MVRQFYAHVRIYLFHFPPLFQNVQYKKCQHFSAEDGLTSLKSKLIHYTRGKQLSRVSSDITQYMCSGKATTLHKNHALKVTGPRGERNEGHTLKNFDSDIKRKEPSKNGYSGLHVLNV